MLPTEGTGIGTRSNGLRAFLSCYVKLQVLFLNKSKCCRYAEVRSYGLLRLPRSAMEDGSGSCGRDWPRCPKQHVALAWVSLGSPPGEGWGSGRVDDSRQGPCVRAAAPYSHQSNLFSELKHPDSNYDCSTQLRAQSKDDSVPIPTRLLNGQEPSAGSKNAPCALAQPSA